MDMDFARRNSEDFTRRSSVDFTRRKSIAELDLTQVKISGPGLISGKTGEKCTFYLSGDPISEFADRITFAVDGPTKPDVMCECEREDGSFECFFVALQPGEYTLNVKYRKQTIYESPSKIKITGDSISAAHLISEVKIHGNASKLGKSLSINEFTVDCRSVEPVIGPLKVHVKGPERASAHLDIKDNKNGTYEVMYKPTSPGMYTMDIKIADQHIPGSPLSIKVTEFLTT
jgi:filamin